MAAISRGSGQLGAVAGVGEGVGAGVGAAVCAEAIRFSTLLLKRPLRSPRLNPTKINCFFMSSNSFRYFTTSKNYIRRHSIIWQKKQYFVIENQSTASLDSRTVSSVCPDSFTDLILQSIFAKIICPVGHLQPVLQDTGQLRHSKRSDPFCQQLSAL